MVTPNKIQFRITGVSFQGMVDPVPNQQGSSAINSPSLVLDCPATFDSTLPSLITLADCPMQIQAGTYTSVMLFIDFDAKMLVNDPINGIFTDPTSPSGFSLNEENLDWIRLHTDDSNYPPAVAGFPGGKTYSVDLSQALVVQEGQKTEMDIIFNGVHKQDLLVENGTIQTYHDIRKLPGPPLDIWPAVGGVGKVESYSSGPSSANYRQVDVSWEMAVLFDRQGNALNMAKGGGNMHICNLAGKPYSSSNSNGHLKSNQEKLLSFAVSNTYESSDFYAYFELQRAGQKGDNTLLKCHVLSSGEALEMSDVTDQIQLTLVAQ